MKKKLSYVLIWILPLALVCVCGYNFINAAWIYVFASDKMQRLEGLAFLFSGIIHAVVLLVTAAVAVALTVCVYKKKRIDEDKNV